MENGKVDSLVSACENAMEVLDLEWKFIGEPTHGDDLELSTVRFLMLKQGKGNQCTNRHWCK